jgi:hypothetical protein
VILKDTYKELMYICDIEGYLQRTNVYMWYW